MNNCNICSEPLGEPIYQSPGSNSITSLCQVLPYSTVVRFCSKCGHLVTDSIENVDEYYKENYKILIDSEAEDQLYEVKDDMPVFRTQHQVSTLFQNVSIPENANVLDYGCAKAATLKQILYHRPDLNPYVYDVSSLYLDFWAKFVPSENQAAFDLPEGWEDHFDLITSFFALEHVERPIDMMSKVFRLLKIGGVFHGTVPNTFTNSGDLVVLDHINHFTKPSLLYLFHNVGFSDISIDSSAHSGAWVVTATKSTTNGDVQMPNIDEVERKAFGMAKYWSDFKNQVVEFELGNTTETKSAIYGAGFYGALITSYLNHPERIVCFIDRNPHRQKEKLFGKSILDPSDMPSGINTVYVGLNPAIAKVEIESSVLFAEGRFRMFYP